MTYYVAVLRDTLDNKKDFIALYAYATTSEVAFLNNMKYHYDYAMTKENTKVYTDFLSFYYENSDLLEYISFKTVDRLRELMIGEREEHFAINLSVYKDK
jgi:hypothetical protein